MKPKTGWVEKNDKGRVVSMVQVLYRRIKVKKTPRKKLFQNSAISKHNDELYYVLDKNVNYGNLSLTGDSVFSKGEILEVEFQVALLNSRLRMLSKISKTTSFAELKQVLFRGDIHFAAVNKGDYENLVALEAKRVQEEAKLREKYAPHSNQPREKGGTLKLTFKKT